jgi:hypothetical protein
MKSAQTIEPDTDRLPSQTVRTVVSLLVFVHLFALLAAVLSNPQDGMASRLLFKLGNVRFLSGYTEALWMESAYDFFHTYGNNDFVIALGTDHRLEADLTLANGETRTVSVPEVGRFPGVRYQHYKNLCNNSARTVGQQGAESLVPAAVLERLMRSHEATAGTIRMKRHLLQTMDQVSSSDSKTRDPNDARYWRVIYSGYGTLRNGRFTYQKLEDAGTTAPVGGASAAAPAASAPASSAPPPSTTAPPPSTAAPPPARPAPRGPSSR